MRLIGSNYRLLVIDIDGTLVDKKGAISAEDKDALARAGAAGIRVSLSTGRVVQASIGIISQLSLDGYHMFFDGALVSNPETGEEVYVEPISPEMVRQIIEFARQDDTNLDLYSVSNYFVERETWTSRIRRQFFGLSPDIGDFNRLWQKERIIKGTLVVSSAEERAKAARFCRKFKDSLSFTLAKTPAYPEVDFIEVLAPGVSKGKALEASASFLGVALSEVIAIGDGANDITLLSKAGLAVVMGNAPDEVKAVADHVTLDVDHHGVAAAIEKFLL